MGRRVVDKGFERAHDLAPDLPVDTHLALGNAHDVLLDSAEGAHLLVVGRAAAGPSVRSCSGR